MAEAQGETTSVYGVYYIGVFSVAIDDVKVVEDIDLSGMAKGRLRFHGECLSFDSPLSDEKPILGTAAVYLRKDILAHRLSRGGKVFALQTKGSILDKVGGEPKVVAFFCPSGFPEEGVVRFFGQQVGQPVLNNELLAEIKEWRKGAEIPRRLLCFPDGPVEKPVPPCDLVSSQESVWDYIERIDDDDLLWALMSDSRTNAEAFSGAVTHLVERKGPKWLLDALQKERNSKRGQNSMSLQAEVLLQILQSPFLKLHVASIDFADMPRERALNVMGKLKRDLDAGLSWSDSYASIAEQNPDGVRRKMEPKVPTTLVCNLASGWFSEIGFMLESMTMDNKIPYKHLETLVKKEKGVYILESDSGVYLYDIESIYRGHAESSL